MQCTAQQLVAAEVSRRGRAQGASLRSRTARTSRLPWFPVGVSRAKATPARVGCTPDCSVAYQMPPPTEQEPKAKTSFGAGTAS